MLTNPYQHLIDNATGLRVQLDIDGNDKSLIVSIRPVRGTTQLVLSRLIHNLCNELRQLDVLAYRPDSDTILTILTEQRPLSADQLHRLEQSSVGRAVAGLATQVSTGVQQHRRRTEIRQRTSSTPFKPNNPPSKVAGGKQRDRKADAKETDNNEGQGVNG